VLTLGVRPNFLDYSEGEREMIMGSRMVLYPTHNYAQFLSTVGKRIFPSLETHLYADEKIKQTTLFYLLGIPHPRTRFYYHLHHKDILKDFSFPFIAKIPRRSSQGRGVFLINDEQDLALYLEMTRIAYIQEYFPHEKDLRVVLLNFEPIICYWRISGPGNFRTNLSQGGQVSFEDLPAEGIETAVLCSKKCNFNEVGLDLIQHRGRWYVIEANMKYGRKAMKMKGLDIKLIIAEKLLSGHMD
jgi:ribosomal protein S6--L-glutamate ligase